MNNKKIAIVLESLPLISVPISFLLLVSTYYSKTIDIIIHITILIAFLGFIPFFIGKKLDKSKIVKILGILDLFATLYVVIFYILAIFSIGI